MFEISYIILFGDESVLEKIVRVSIVVLAAIFGLATFQFMFQFIAPLIATEYLNINLNIFGITLARLISGLMGILVGGIVGYIISPYLIRLLRKFSMWVENQLNKMKIHDVIAGVCGLAIGLIIANLWGVAFLGVPIVGSYLPIVFSIVLGYLGIHITIKKRDEIVALFPRLFRDQPKDKKGSAEKNAVKKAYKLLDTSVIIDGRIADICGSGFVEGTLLIPVFVLEELQHIADSADLLKRTRGRRGLDVLKRIQTDFDMFVEIDETDFEDIAEVDSKLIKLAQAVGGKIVTNDYNLNKVADLQGITVLNINELANAVKPVVIPGEDMTVTIVKDGKEQGQGVAYLDDGTMIVVEGGRKFINTTLPVTVTSVLQTAAGRMIFAKPK
nr:PIN/TRAM domain-containing protein [Pectinatus brassicae]